MDIDDTSEIHTSGYVFRVLYGTLNGIEFSLDAQEYFICVGDPEKNIQPQNLVFAERTLFLPASEPCHNFVVNLAAQDSEHAFSATVSYPDHQETLDLAFNTICRIGEVCFAIKREGSHWADEIIRNDAALLSPLSSAQIEARPELIPPPAYFPRTKWIGMLCLIFLIVGSSLWWFDAYKRPVTSDDQLQKIVGNRGGFFVFPGNDNVNYVFTQTLREAEWARLAINRRETQGTWKVVTPHEEEERMARLLEKTDIQFFTLRFNDPRTPILVMSSTRNPVDEKSLGNIKNILLAALPYANNIDIDLIDDKEIVDKAQQGLRALGFEYKTVSSTSGVTLTSSLPTLDVHLGEFGRFVEQFYRIWGRRYVHFSAELSDDWTKDKSFRYNQNGYISMNKSHWIFKEKDQEDSNSILNLP